MIFGVGMFRPKISYLTKKKKNLLIELVKTYHILPFKWMLKLNESWSTELSCNLQLNKNEILKKKKKKIDLGFQPKNISIESAKILAFSISKIHFFLF